MRPRDPNLPKGVHKSYHKELRRLEVVPITELGRRILVRHAIVEKWGRLGAKYLAQQLNVEELTIWRIVKGEDALWYERKEYIDVAARLCQLLRVDHSWLFHTIDYRRYGRSQLRSAPI